MQVTLEQAIQIAAQKHQAGALQEAESIYRQIVASNPNYPPALHFLGLLAHQVGQNDDAVNLMQRSIELNPNVPEFHQNFGLLLHSIGRFEDAVKHCNVAIALNPRFPSAYSTLGGALQSLGRVDEAMDAFNKAIELNPNYAEAINNLGIAHESKDQFTLALAAYRRALSINPKFFSAHINLANVMLLLGRIDEAIAHNEQAIALSPPSWPLVSNLLMLYHYHPTLGAKEILRLHRERTAQLDNITPPPHTNDRSPDRKLRVGYVSSDFREHPIAFFLESILRNHDRDYFEIFCYSDVPLADVATDRLRPLADQWRPTVGMTDLKFIELVRREQIDILIELSVNTAGNRLFALAHKPAPIQLTYLGYCGTTGVTAIDYRITDEAVDPPDLDETQTGTEKLLRLPNVFCCYQPPPDAPDVSPLPALANGHITFGAMCPLAKINEKVVELWSKILTELPTSRLIIRSRGMDDPQAAAEVLSRFEKHGVDGARIEPLGRIKLSKYLETYNRIDIELDPFPYSAHTTTCHALWMGVPVITLPGETTVSRVSASLLRAVGLPEFIASSPEDYVRIASDFAGDFTRLGDLRKGMRDRLQQSPLLDGEQLTRNLESAYRQVWRAWCEKPV